MIQKAKCSALLVSFAASLSLPSSRAQNFPLDSTTGLQPHDVTVEAVTWQDRKAVRVTPVRAANLEMVNPKNGEGGGIAVLPITFHNGAIEAEVAGKPRAGSPTDARGFVGIAFRVGADPSNYECFYLRPTNGRADDQLRRNHSAQYISMPEYEWSRLRKVTPGQYESYVDLQPGVWTRIRIVVSGPRAELYVNGADQPCLIVRHLKGTHDSGALALWVGDGTEGYFSNLKVTVP